MSEKRSLAPRVARIGLSPTLEIADLARSLREAGKDVLDFSAGQPDFPTPEPVKAAGRRAIEENRTRYTANAGLVELRAAIAARIERDRGAAYAPEQILVSTGAKASLYFACLALADRGDEILIPVPYWTSYPEQARLAGAEPVFVPTAEANGFKLAADDLERALTDRTRILVLNSPSNPTGACYSLEELAPLAEVCVRRGVWILADEIYSRLVYDGRSPASVVQLGPEVRERTVLVDGMSKTYAMTGWRIGWAAGPREVVSAMARIQSHSTSNATSISQWASIAALELPDEELAPRLAAFDRRRREIVARLRAIRGVECQMPGGAFYVFPNVSGCFGGGLRSGRDVARLLLQRAGVAAVPGEAFGSDRHVRFSYACSLETVQAGMDRVAEALRDA
jgi:aspartate aminotransferase